MKYSLIIADDEPLVRERIVSLVRTFPQFEVSALCANGAEVVHAMRHRAPDVLLLDIKMPRMDGFDVLEVLGSLSTRIVFITAYDEYALKAFDYAAFDYLLKPVVKKRFEQTMNRLLDALSKQGREAEAVIRIKQQGVLQFIRIDRITLIEAANNHVLIHADGHRYRKRITLSAMAERLRNSGFMRIHRTYVINPVHIRQMARIYRGDYLIKLSDGRVVPTSKTYRDSVVQLQTDNL